MPTSLTKESDVDVLIIGAGPAGVMASTALARAGVSVRIIDKRPTGVAAGRADGIQPRTIEVLQSYGLADRLLKEANQVHVAAFYNPSTDGGIELSERVSDLTVSSARYPFEATLHQGAIEAIFLDNLKELGVEVSRSIYPTEIQLSEDEDQLNDPNAHAVRVILKHANPAEDNTETEVVNAKFVLGTDGAHSWVRKSFDIAMEGEHTEYVWGVVDMVPETDFPDIRNRCAIHSTNASCMIIPREGDKVRLYMQLADDEAADITSGKIDKEKYGPNRLLDVARKTMHPYSFRTPSAFDWWTIYIIGQRVASSFSVKDRVFIAGDACHTHSPKAGQGMNASMNDSHNLAWKLVHVLRGWAKPSLLSTYEFERRKFAQDLIAFDKEFSALFSSKPRTDDNQEGVSHEQFLETFQRYGNFTSGVGIHYAESPITCTKYQSIAEKLIVGQRVIPQALVRAADFRPVEIQDLLPSDTRIKVLVFTGNTSDGEQRAKVDDFSQEFRSVLENYAPAADIYAMFDILFVSSASKANVRYTDIPDRLRSHWSKVLIDEKDAHSSQGGDAYINYGISRSDGAVVVVRPDGYVGMIAPLNDVPSLDQYFASFINSAY